MATRPTEPLNRHDGRPCGFWIFHWPPRVVAWPFCAMLPNLLLVRNRSSIVNVTVDAPGSRLRLSGTWMTRSGEAGGSFGGRRTQR